MDTFGKNRIIWIALALAALLGIGAWIAAPSIVTAALPFVLLAACPLAMLFMMGGMGHGHNHSMHQRMTRDQQVARFQDDRSGAQDGEDSLGLDDHVVALKARLARVEAEQASLARQLADLGANRTTEDAAR